jgi:hypothetical protein
MTIQNLDAVLRQLRRYGEGAREGMREGLAAEAEALKRRSQALCPVAEDRAGAGLLRDSAYVSLSGDSAEIGYSAPYATQVHERLDWHHDDGQAKFLEQARNEREAAITRGIAEAIMAATRRRAR